MTLSRCPTSRFLKQMAALIADKSTKSDDKKIKTDDQPAKKTKSEDKPKKAKKADKEDKPKKKRVRDTSCFQSLPVMRLSKNSLGMKSLRILRSWLNLVSDGRRLRMKSVKSGIARPRRQLARNLLREKTKIV